VAAAAGREPRVAPVGEPLPRFRYHPDPVATGAVEASPLACACHPKGSRRVAVPSISGGSR
jgi:uncharacterized protein CbrC (UPF0167 family)